MAEGKWETGMVVFMYVMNNVWRIKYLTIMIVENLNNKSCGRNVCSRVDISELECLVVSEITLLNGYGILTG